MAASILAHAIALIWIVAHAVAAPSGSVRAAAPDGAAAAPEPVQVELVEPMPPPAAPRRAPNPRPGSAVAAHRTTAPHAAAPQPAISAAASTTAPPAPDLAPPQPAMPAATGTAAPMAGDAAPAIGPPRSDGPGGHGDATAGPGSPATRVLERFPGADMRVSEKLIEAFVAHETPQPPAINDAAHASDARIAELDLQLANPAWRATAGSQQVADAGMDLESLQRQRDDLTMKPIGGGRYRNEQETFTIDVAPDGTVAIHDKPAISFDPRQWTFRFDITDMVMRARGEDPYARAKLRFLDATRDERAELGRRYRHEQLGRSAELMLANIDRLWSMTRDPARRREGMFELWDDCAETGDAELLDGADAARRMVISEIQARLRGADAYTPEELARFNARRTSAAPFAPYDDPPHLAP